MKYYYVIRIKLWYYGVRAMITLFKLWINCLKCAKKMYKYFIRWENKSHHFLIDTVKKVKVNINMQYWSIVYTIIGFWCQIHNVIVNVTYIELTSRQWLINLYIFIDIILTLLILHESNLNITFFNIICPTFEWIRIYTLDI